MKKRRGWLVLGVISGLLAGGVWYWFHNQMRYEVIEITLPAGFVNPSSLQLNDTGTVAGIMTHTADKSQHVFYWNRNTGLMDLDNLGIAGEDVAITDMNNAGQIIGFYFVSEKLTEEAVQSGIKPRRDSYSFFYDPQQGLRNIPATPGRTDPWVTAINNHGQVAGLDFKRSGNNLTHWMFLWTPDGGTEDLKAPGFPHDINDSGHIVGIAYNPKASFIWTRETGKQSLGESATGDYVSLKINNADQVIGLYGSRRKQSYLFQWDPRQGFRNIGQQSEDYDIFGIADITDDGAYCFGGRRHWKLPWGLGEGQDDQSIVSIPGRFKTNLNRIVRKMDLEFIAADMNNNGWIVGVARDKQSNQFEGILLLIPKNYPKPK